MILKDLKVLRLKSKETTIEECTKINIFSQLERELKMSTTPGVGLAAIQIGVPLRACVVIMNTDKDLLRMINPVIEEQYEPMKFHGERCLSLDLSVDTDRYQGVVANWLDYDTKEIKRASFYGIEAVIMQHEIDHMDGMLIIDRASKVVPKVGRNEPCPCGSGKKYKKCCGG